MTLEFTEAVITHDTLRTDVNMRGGSLILVTGSGMVVDADSLTVRYGDVKIRPSAKPDEQVTLRVQLTGRMRYGWIEQR